MESFSVMLLINVIPDEDEAIFWKRALLFRQERFDTHKKNKNKQVVNIEFNFTSPVISNE